MTVDYIIENLGPDRFEKLVQGIIHSEFIDAQSFPVRQPDGGRDGLSFIKNKEKVNIFQVKYVENPLREDRHKWLEKTLKSELKKIIEIIERGVRVESYYFISNIKGTAHLDTGLIDKFYSICKLEIPRIKYFCWFRDDLISKLDSNWGIKWSYPEILSGRDILGYLIGKRTSNKNLLSIVNAYLKDQYEYDRIVKFKQVEIDNPLFELFIDVPLVIDFHKRYSKEGQFLSKKLNRILLNILNTQKEKESFFVEDFYDFHRYDRTLKVGATVFFTNQEIQSIIPKMVLEGAPGQGKSTITQFLCQVNRHSILYGEQSLNEYNLKLFQDSGVRIPIKIDLRDLALFIGGNNPFLDFEDEYVKVKPKTLESFIALHISHYSGGTAFSIDEFRSLIELCSLLIVFDGFDEVADVSARSKIISVIKKGVLRIETNAISLQVIITSRPTAFSPSVKFSEEEYPHFQLDNLPSGAIITYAEKWMKAKRIDQRERKTIIRIIKNKLSHPHLQSLAQNPMQLAIFLSLIHQQGESLPDKRTALYDDYIKKFFDRESEKSKTVRENRELLLDIHQYLAFHLHINAEKGGDGRIEHEKLILLIQEYLRKEEHDINLAKELFGSIEERVMVIVARTVGVYEFEVQPLREFFCAKFLYNTTPYSPVGAIKTGTLPDRFDAMAPNLYWLNVVRFFAGCFSKGQLPMLIERIEYLTEIEPVKYTTHPEVLTSMLLNDHVFKQYPRLMRRIVKIMLNGLASRSAVTKLGYTDNSALYRLPAESGRQELIQLLFKILQENPPVDYSDEIIAILKQNMGDEVLNQWEAIVLICEENDLIQWLDYGRKLGIIHRMPDSIIENIYKYDTLSSKVSRILILGNRQEAFINIENRVISFVKDVMSGNLITFHSLSKTPSIISKFIQIFSLSTYNQIFLNDGGSSLIYILTRNSNIRGRDAHEEFYKLEKPTSRGFFEIEKKIFSIYMTYQKLIERKTSEWTTSLNIWNLFIETARDTFGDSWLLYQIATVSAGIRSSTEKYLDHDDLYNNSISLCNRARCARLKANAPKWWVTQLNNTSNNAEKLFALFIINTWAGKNVILECMPIITELIDQLSSDEFKSLLNAKYFINIGKGRNINLPDDCEEINSTKMFLFLENRLSIESLERYHDNYDFEDWLDFIPIYIREKLSLRFINLPNDKENLSKISQYYTKSNISFDHLIRRYAKNKKINISYETGKYIMANPSKYPRQIVTYAEGVCREKLDSAVETVSEIVSRTSWFI